MGHIHSGRAPMKGRYLPGLFCLLAMSATHAAAPKISGTPPATGTVGGTYSFTPTASDADGNALRFSIANKPGFARFNSRTGRLYGVPFAEHARTWSNIVISVTDGRTKVSLPAYALRIKPNANQSPIISGTPPPTAKVGTAYTFTPTAKDPEGKALTFTIRNKPSWITFDSRTGRISGTPGSGNVATFSGIRIAARDGVSRASLPIFSITVSAASGTTNTAPKISGTPPTSTSVSTAYAFQPTASDANGDVLAFSITNKPSWASFSTSTGRLSGTPAAANVGTTSNIVIKVSDGKATASLPAFALSVTQGGSGAATVSWTPPTRNTDGSTLTNLAGFRISYGTSSSALTNTVQVSNASVSRYVIENLSGGTWYFAVRAYNSTGKESTPSGVVSKRIY
jgi:hypothetical protein